MKHNIIPVCKIHGRKLLRWGWYFDPEHPVYYWYAYCCDDLEWWMEQGPIEPFLVVLPEGTMEG
jgi:hypothetical protein